jgi:CSLREA domain-containing protein
LNVNKNTDHDDGACTAGDCTLREAINLANGNPGPNTITFASSVSGIIALTGGELAISDGVAIAGPGAATLAVSGTANISGLALANGSPLDGAWLSVENGATAQLTNVELHHNSAGGASSKRSERSS